MRIDVHTHAFAPKIADKAVHQLEGHYGIHPVGTGKADDLIEQMDKAGLDRAVVLQAATSPKQVVPANDWAINLQKNNPRFIPFGTLHPDFDRNAEELDRLEENGIQGLKFHPDFQGFRMDDPKFYSLMEQVGDRFICLYHVGDSLPPAENPSCPKKMADLYRAFPETTMIAAHMGGYRQWEYALEHIADTGIYVDCSSVLEFVDDDLLTKLYSVYPEDKVLFGSDYPLYGAASEIEELTRRLELSSEQLDNLLSRAGELFE